MDGMKCYEKHIAIARDHRLSQIHAAINAALQANETPIRFAVVDSDSTTLHCEVGILQGAPTRSAEGIFAFQKRPFERSEKFTAMMMVPTGIAASVGGDAGDAQAAARLLAASCDCLITHPNAVNGSDIMEAPPNALYVEGSTFSRLIMGSIGLIPTRKNKILLAVDGRAKKYQELVDLSINSASAARLGLGANIDVVVVNPPLTTTATMVQSGRATGELKKFERLTNALDTYQTDYDAFAISSVINTVHQTILSYYRGETSVNPFGGAEALMTHALSLLYNKPIAHSPMNPTIKLHLTYAWGVVEPPLASEAISKTYLHCILKGLHQSPRILNQSAAWNVPGAISVADVNCLVQPDRCVGLPTLAALAQGIPVIAVNDETNIMKNDLEQLPWNPGQLLRSANYIEAAGMVTALRAGISLDTVLRPIGKTRILGSSPPTTHSSFIIR